MKEVLIFIRSVGHPVLDERFPDSATNALYDAEQEGFVRQIHEEGKVFWDITDDGLAIIENDL